MIGDNYFNNAVIQWRTTIGSNVMGASLPKPPLDFRQRLSSCWGSTTFSVHRPGVTPGRACVEKTLLGKLFMLLLFLQRKREREMVYAQYTRYVGSCAYMHSAFWRSSPFLFSLSSLFQHLFLSMAESGGIPDGYSGGSVSTCLLYCCVRVFAWWYGACVLKLVSSTYVWFIFNFLWC